jgi:hypothetical protein
MRQGKALGCLACGPAGAGDPVELMKGFRDWNAITAWANGTATALK